MAQVNLNFKKCPYCRGQNRPLSTYCSHCGRELSRHHKKVQMAKKIFKGSRIVIKSALSKKYREKTMNKVMGQTYGFNMNQNMGNSSPKDPVISAIYSVIAARFTTNWTIPWARIIHGSVDVVVIWFTRISPVMRINTYSLLNSFFLEIKMF